jgi:glutaminyl-peptide cyclotransferase
MVFFDGEEAFKTWSDHDSLYGSRHLAHKWNQQPISSSSEQHARCQAKGIVSELDRIDLFVLLDLIGTANPRFHSFYPSTNSVFSRLVQIGTTFSSSNSKDIGF